MSAPVGLAPAEQTPTAAAAAVIGPDMALLWQRFPPRISAPSWPATEQAGEVLLARLLAAPFTVTEDRVARARRRLGLIRLLGWLAEHPGDTWQQRWLVSGADRWATPSGGARCWPGHGHETRSARCLPRATYGHARCCSSAPTWSARAWSGC